MFDMVDLDLKFMVDWSELVFKIIEVIGQLYLLYIMIVR